METIFMCILIHGKCYFGIMNGIISKCAGSLDSTKYDLAIRRINNVRVLLLLTNLWEKNELKNLVLLFKRPVTATHQASFLSCLTLKAFQTVYFSLNIFL